MDFIRKRKAETAAAIRGGRKKIGRGGPAGLDRVAEALNQLDLRILQEATESEEKLRYLCYFLFKSSAEG